MHMIQINLLPLACASPRISYASFRVWAIHKGNRPDARDFSRERKAAPIPIIFILIELYPQYNDADSYG